MGRDMVLSGRYELVEKLGQGGMGTVHRGVDRQLRRTVAVKLLSSELAHDPQSRARFRREAHAAAALNHPAVATIHDVGEEPHPDGPRPYLVMRRSTRPARYWTRCGTATNAASCTGTSSPRTSCSPDPTP